MGFAAHLSQAEVQPMLILASLPRLDLPLAKLASDQKVDACYFPQRELEKGKRALELNLKALGETPWGVILKEASSEGMKQLQEMGCDFLVVALESLTAPLVGQEDISIVLQVEEALPDSVAQALEGLPLEAIIFSESAPLTLRRWLAFHRLAQLSGCPAFLPAPRPALKEELEALWEAGVRGLTVDLEGEGIREHFGEISEALKSMKASPRKARERRFPLLPSVSGGWEESEQEEPD